MEITRPINCIAAAVFLVSLARFFVVPALGLPANSAAVAELNGLLPAVAHLLLFPIVAALSAPTWARAAGYGWLVIDICSDVMALNGVPDAYLPPSLPSIPSSRRGRRSFCSIRRSSCCRSGLYLLSAASPRYASA